MADKGSKKNFLEFIRLYDKIPENFNRESQQLEMLHKNA